MKKVLVNLKPVVASVLSVMLLASCGSDNNGTNDAYTTTIASAPTNVILETVSSPAKDDLYASWLPAQDDNTPSNQLIYQLHASTDKNFEPSADTLIFSGKNITSARVEDKLEGGQTYYVRLVVVDADGLSTGTDAVSVTILATDPVVEPVTLPTLISSPQYPVQSQSFSVQLEGGSSDEFAKVIWRWDGGEVTKYKPDVYKPVLVPATATKGKDTLVVKATLYDDNGKEVGVVKKDLTISSPVSTQKLTVTGITKCGNYAFNTQGIESHNNNLDCSLSVDSEGNPIPSGQDGHIQAGEPMSYTLLKSNNAECVQDKVTGLIWEQKTDNSPADLRDKDNTYTWYNPNSSSNGGDAGVQNGGTCADSNCDTNAYIQALNNANYCGYSDWRMPTTDELISIVDYGRVNPSINPIFVNTKRYSYWSALPQAAWKNDSAGIVGFGNGYSGDDNKSNGRLVRAVRNN